MSDIPGYDNWKLQGPLERLSDVLWLCNSCGKQIDGTEWATCDKCGFEGCVHCIPDGPLGELMMEVNACELHVNEMALREIHKLQEALRSA